MCVGVGHSNIWWWGSIRECVCDIQCDLCVIQVECVCVYVCCSFKVYVGCVYVSCGGVSG